jgi:hypothetical protein
MSGAGAAEDRTSGPNHCTRGERVLYSCAFPRSIGSLCADADSVHYRFGPRGKPQIDLASLPDWSNVHLGDLRGQGNGYQRHVRISRGRVHYLVYEGVNGDLTEVAGRRYSGIEVLEGARGDTVLASLQCPHRPAIALGDALLAERAVSEEPDSPFDMWF